MVDFDLAQGSSNPILEDIRNLILDEGISQVWKNRDVRGR